MLSFICSSQAEKAMVHIQNIHVAICSYYMEVVKFDMPIPCNGVVYDPLRGFHGFRWNLNSSAFQRRALYAYLRLRRLLST